MGTRNHEPVLDWSQNMYTVIDYFVLSLNTTKKQNAYNVPIYYVDSLFQILNTHFLKLKTKQRVIYFFYPHTDLCIL